MELSITSANTEPATTTDPVPAVTKETENTSQNSPDDGMGDSIARGSSTTTETDRYNFFFLFLGGEN